MSNYQLFQNDLPSKVLKSFKGDISIDTETLGLNIKRDRLCLIQLRNETDKKIYLIKFEEDLSPKLSKNIKILLENNNLTKIFHFGRFDMAVLKENLKINVKNIFCTKVASKIARTASSFHAYKDLVKELCGKDISKREQQSDWGDPNLSEKQISYAAQDTQYLFEIKDKLTKMLIREKRIHLFEKCMKVLPVLVDMEISGYKISTFEH